MKVVTPYLVAPTDKLEPGQLALIPMHDKQTLVLTMRWKGQGISYLVLEGAYAGMEIKSSPSPAVLVRGEFAVELDSRPKPMGKSYVSSKLMVATNGKESYFVFKLPSSEGLAQGDQLGKLFQQAAVDLDTGVVDEQQFIEPLQKAGAVMYFDAWAIVSAHGVSLASS